MRKFLIGIIVGILCYSTSNAGYVEDIIAVDQSKMSSAQKITQFFALKKKIYTDLDTAKTIEKKDTLLYAQKILNKKVSYYIKLSQNKKYLRVANGGGSYKGITYTNSIDSLEQNKKYYRYFEIDFSWTRDEKMVCIADWDESFTKTFGYSLKGKIPTQKQFIYYTLKNKDFKNCTLSTLITWLEQNPGFYILVNAQGENDVFLEEIAHLYPDYKNRFIPEIFNPNNFKVTQELGYSKIIWNLTGYKASNQEILQYVKRYNFFAITLPTDKAKTGLSLDIKALGKRVYAKTVNTLDEYRELQLFGVDEIYTDSLTRYE